MNGIKIVNTMARLEAHWALHGKRAGSREDYGVLAASTLFSHDEFSSIIAHFSPGTPPTQRPAPDDALPLGRGAGDLPWIILNWAGRDDELQLGLAIQRATAEVDGVGRQIAETSCFFVSYAALAEHGQEVSYAGLYEAVKDILLPRQDGAPITLEVPTLDREEMARRVAAIGERSVSLVADRLLTGPVTITRADGTSPVERLRFIDAVASMLPYGYRTKLAASTWSDSGVRHRMRLAFAERRYSGTEAYPWHFEPDGTPAEPGGYLAQLDRLRGRSDDSLKQFELSFIIATLAAETKAQRFDQPKYAIDCLAFIDLPFAVLSAVRANRAEQSRVRELFADDRVLELPAQWRVEVLAELVGYGDPADWANVTRWWEKIAPADPPALVPALATACRLWLWADAPDFDAVDAHVRLAAPHRLTDELLSRVIEPPERPQALMRGLAPGARLLHKWITEGGRHEEFTRALAALPGNPALACGLAEQVALSPGRGKTQKIDWLMRAMPGLAPFANLIGNVSQPVTRETVALLAQAHLCCIGSLLRVADNYRRLGQVLPALTSWLGMTAELDSSWRAYIAEQLRTLSPRAIEQAADADLGLLAVGRPLMYFPHCTTYQDARRYSRRLGEQWNAIVQYNGNSRPDPFEDAFARSLDAGWWVENELLASMVADICGQLVGKNGPPRFRGLVASVLNATPEARNWPFAVDWMKNFGDQQDTARNTMGSLYRLPATAPPEQIGAVCYRAFVNQVPPRSAGSVLAESDAINQAPRVDEVLAAVRSVFWADQPPADRGPLRRLWNAVFTSEQDRLRRWFDDVAKATMTARDRLAEAAAKAGPRRQGNERR